MAAVPPNSISGLAIASLRGGMNDTDPPIVLPDDQCELAVNVEFFYSALGERRLGCGPIDIAGSHLDSETFVSHISQWFPTGDVLAPQWFVMGATPGSTTTTVVRTDGVWSALTITDAVNTSSPDIFEVNTQALGGLLYVSYRSAQDRLHVYDKTTLRRTGLTQPAAPTGANEGVGTYATVRYFRVRYITKSGATILRRSEPSDALTFTPSGTGAGTTVTRPALVSEGETHWELEASDDNADFYLIATAVVATTTVNDETALPAGYADIGPLSDAIGAYLLPPSAKYLAVDGDRLLMGGHWTDPLRQSDVSWSPVSNDPGVGNGERYAIVTTGGTAVDSTLTLDSYDGGPITGIAASANGTWYAFKWSHIYKMARTGDPTQAYTAITISSTQGAIPGSIVKGLDENGAACIYFLDPLTGPSRIGAAGLQTITGLRRTWGRVNLQADTITARGCYYPYKGQVHWWVATDGVNVPNLKLVLQVSELSATAGNAVSRGWSLATGHIATCTAVAVLTEKVSIGGFVQTSNRPVIGHYLPGSLQRCDTEDNDNGTAYGALIRTRAYVGTNLLQLWGAMSVTLMATANANASFIVKLVRDFGLETREAPAVSLAPADSEGYVFRALDGLAISEANVIQIEIVDEGVWLFPEWMDDGL